MKGNYQQPNTIDTLLNERSKTEKMLIRLMIDERKNETETLMLSPIDVCTPVV
jgi:hypothetical protein